jgi:hypothetical protein
MWYVWVREERQSRIFQFLDLAKKEFAMRRTLDQILDFRHRHSSTGWRRKYLEKIFDIAFLLRPG